MCVACLLETNCESAVGEGWYLVRRTTTAGHSATDQLEGTDVYGTYAADPEQTSNSFSIDFETAVPSWNEILLSTGTCNHWLIMTRFQAIGEVYNNVLRQISRSHTNDFSYQSTAFRRGSA